MKKFISMCLAAFFAMSSMNVILAEENKLTIYVSPTGSDDASGTIEKPLKTLDEARKRVRSYLDDGYEIEVVFRGGEYRVTESVKFTEADSGTKEFSVVYKAYDGEKVEFKGSVLLDSSKANRVTDENVLSKLYDDVKNKIVELDLTSCGITKEKLKEYINYAGQNALSGGEENGLYQNSRAQRISEWPNGIVNYAQWDYAPSIDTLHYTDTEPKRWGEAKYMWLGGFPAIDYSYQRNTVTGIDVDANTITGYNATFTSTGTRRWKAYNLIEEIDVPGEYYIDPDSMKLYWYPEEKLTESKLEFSWFNDHMLNIQFAENITFENLCFTQTRGSAVYMKRVKNVDFIGCEFTDIGQMGIEVTSDLSAETNKEFAMARAQLDGSYDCDISRCRFDNTGSVAIQMNGGNVDTLTPANNSVDNNIITRSCQFSKYNPAIRLTGCGISCQYNNISNMPGQAITVGGNDLTIRYNEIYNTLQDADDAGAIYTVRDTLRRGTEISYNYIHDIITDDALTYNFTSAIYIDDREGGKSIHHNIIENVNTDIAINGGVDIESYNNTSINIGKYYMRFIDGGISENGTEDKKWHGYIADEELYFSRYKNLKEIIQMGRENTINPELAKFNKITGNLGVNCADISIGTNTLKYGKVKDNVQIEECNDFVDSEKGDYRIKKNSDTYKNSPGVLNEDFDISLIGVQQDYSTDKEYNKFKQLYPKNGQQGMNSSNTKFVWQSAKDATSYRLVIASDPDLKNVIFDESFFANVVTVDCLKPNMVYYWKVWADNNSLDFGGEWESSSPIFSFATTLYEPLDTTHLSEALEETKREFESIDVGEKTGQYRMEIKEKVGQLINFARIMIKARDGMISQKSIDKITNLLSESFTGLGMTNIGYIDLSEYFTRKENWTSPVEVSTDGVVKINKEITGVANLGMPGIDYMAGSVMYSFDAKLDVPSTYVVFGINKESGSNPYSSKNVGYSFLFKQNILELHVSNGSTKIIPVTVEHNFANDGNFHKFEYGYINTDVGNIVMLYVDGQKVIEYLDVLNQAVKIKGAFMVHLGDNAVSVQLKKSENIRSMEDLNKLLDDALKRSAKTIVDSYETKVVVMQENGNKIFTPDGIYDTEGVTVFNGIAMMPFDVIPKVLGAEISRNGSVIKITCDGKNIDFYIDENCMMVNGVKSEIEQGAISDGNVVRIPVETMLKAMEKPYTYSQENGLIIVGNIIFMNYINSMNKTRLLMDVMKDMPEFGDYIFAEYE